MRRTSSVLLVALVCSAGCTARQAPVARSVGKVLSIGGVVGLIGTSFLGGYSGQRELLLGFSLTSALGIGLFAAGELSQPEIIWKKEPIDVRNRRWARILTERAQGAARDGRCARVRRLEVRVKNYDPALHDVVFMQDPAIQKCMAEAAPVLAPDEGPPITPPVEALPPPPVTSPGETPP